MVIEPHVRWLATLSFPSVRHGARYHDVIEYRQNAYAQGLSLCGMRGVWANAEREKWVMDLPVCRRCYRVIIDDANTEEFFGGDNKEMR